MFQIRSVDRIKAHISRSKTFYRESYPTWDNVKKKNGTSWPATDDGPRKIGVSFTQPKWCFLQAVPYKQSYYLENITSLLFYWGFQKQLVCVIIVFNYKFVQVYTVRNQKYLFGILHTLQLFCIREWISTASFSLNQRVSWHLREK
jgi:hypothetical protein